MLSLLELERAARAIDRGLRDARLDRIVQPDARSLALVLHVPGGGRRTLRLSCAPGLGRVSEPARPPRAPETPPPFAAFLRKHLSGARLRGAALRGGDRQLALRLETREGRYTLLLSLFGARSNLYLLDAGDALMRSLRPLDETRPELAVGRPWSDPASPPPASGEDRFAAVGDDDLLAEIERAYAEREEAGREADLGRRVEAALRKERKQLERRLERVEAELAEADEAAALHRRGELLKGVLAQVEPGARSVTARDYETGEAVEIPLDPALSPRDNLEAVFKRYQKLLRRLTKAGGQVDELRARLAELEALDRERAALAAAGGDLEAWAARGPVAALLGRHAPPVRRAPAPRGDDRPRSGRFKGLPRRLHPRRYRSRDGLEIWVGRSDEANDHLTTRLARGNDLFFHLQGQPGSHVILRTEGRADPPSESLLDAAELAVHFSKARAAGRAEVHVVPIKNVHKPKGAKPGLVYVTGGRTLHLRREEARLRRVLGARIDEEDEGGGGGSSSPRP